MPVLPSIASRIIQKLDRSIAYVGYVVRSGGRSNINLDPTISSGYGAPTRVEPKSSTYHRIDATDMDHAYYVSAGGGTWVAVPTEESGALQAATDAANAAADAQDAANLANTRTLGRRDPWAVYGPWAVDGDGGATASGGAGLVGATLVATEAAAAFCKRDNGGVIGNLSAAVAGFTSLYQLFPDVPVDNDAVYFGASTRFCELAFDMSATVQASTGNCFTWEYYNGSTWSTLAILYDGTMASVHTGARSFERDGAIVFLPPANWASTTVNAQAAYWVRCRVSTAANMGVALGATNSKKHYVCTPGGSYTAAHTGTITGIRAVSGKAPPLGTTADTKFFVMNYTTGLATAELTWPKTTRSVNLTGLSLVVTAGDTLGVVVTQEDGTQEHSDVAFEVTYA